MPVFTMELWRVLEITDDIGLNDYPIFSEDYREHLNSLIKDHYWTREIGHETIEMFRRQMNIRMRTVMGYYNELYLTQRLTFDPLANMDIRTITSGVVNTNAETTGETSSEMTNKGDSRAVQSDTPQVRLSGDGDYASSAADSFSESTASGTGAESTQVTSAESNESESRTIGYQGAPATLLMEYRRSLINIDALVIDELGDLFMGVWGNGDSFAPYPYTPLPTL